MGGSFHFMTLINNYNRRIWIYFPKTNDQALRKFKEWHVMVEKKLGKKPKILG